MEQLSNRIKITYFDEETNRLLSAIPEGCADRESPRVKFNQNEELFLEFQEDFIIPGFPIHHDMKNPIPEEAYIRPLREFIKSLSQRIPSAFQGLTYYFDASEIMKPCFFRLYRVGEAVYLYLLRIDLGYRPFESSLVEAGTNDRTPTFRTRRLYMESEFIPLESVSWDANRVSVFNIRQLISNTWIGETGRGYLVRGIWMDSGLSKFFTKLVLPEGGRIYPFYPLFCKYKTVCAEAPVLLPEFRRKTLPLLHRALTFLGPEMERIQNSLKANDFSEKMPLFMELRSRIPPTWREVYAGYTVRPYLNERDMKEFALEISNN